MRRILLSYINGGNDLEARPAALQRPQQLAAAQQGQQPELLVP